MDQASIDARVLGTKQLLERHFGEGIHIEVIRPLDLPPEDIETKRPQISTATSNLEDIRSLLGDCQRCQLCRTRKNLVFGCGSPHAELVVLGEAPGKHEDEQGEPFVGKAGKMLDDMLAWMLEIPKAEAKRAREMVYILNVIKCRPPGNRNPDEHEVEACLPFLQRQLDAIRPRVILLMGAVALRALFHTEHGITRHRGTWMEWNGIPVMPTFHPAYLLRKPQDKRLTFEDLQEVKRKMEGQ